MDWSAGANCGRQSDFSVGVKMYGLGSPEQLGTIGKPISKRSRYYIFELMMTSDRWRTSANAKVGSSPGAATWTRASPDFDGSNCYAGSLQNNHRCCCTRIFFRLCVRTGTPELVLGLERYSFAAMAEFTWPIFLTCTVNCAGVLSVRTYHTSMSGPLFGRDTESCDVPAAI